MSYMLEFPYSPLPKDVLSPPYVLFGINGIDIFSQLPTQIPLAVVQHFAPNIRKWILPAPEIGPPATDTALRNPYVGVNIIADIEVEGLGRILVRMMQIANAKLSPGNFSNFTVSPNLMVSIATHKAWTALELPPKGIDALHIHMQMTLMMGPPVTLLEMKGLWNNFSVKSPILLEMGQNFVRNYIDRKYKPSEGSAVRHWYLETAERWQFFRVFEKKFPGFDDVQKDLVKETSERHKKEEERLRKLISVENTRKAHLRELLENQSHDEQEKADKAGRASKRRMERAGSADSSFSTASVETAIRNPSKGGPSSSEAEEYTSIPAIKVRKSPASLSQPVDGGALGALLNALANDERVQNRATSEESRMSSPEVAQLKPATSLSRNETKTTQRDLSEESRFYSLTGLVKQPLATATVEASGPKSKSKVAHEGERDGTDQINLDPGRYKQETPAFEAETLVPKIESVGRGSEAVGQEQSTNEQTQDEMARVEVTLAQYTIQDAKEDDGNQAAKQDDALLDSPEGLAYLKPTAYEGPR